MTSAACSCSRSTSRRVRRTSYTSTPTRSGSTSPLGCRRGSATGGWCGSTDVDDTRRLSIGGEVVTPPGLQVFEVLDTADDSVLIAASEEPIESHVYRWSAAGLERLTTAPGVYRAVAGGDVLALSAATLEEVDVRWTVWSGGAQVAELASFVDQPSVHAFPQLLRTGPRQLRTALLLPHDDARRTGPLPVLMDPYGGPHGQMVIAARRAYLSSQWFADQGFAVIIADGRGTPSRGPAWDRSIAFDLADLRARGPGRRAARRCGAVSRRARPRTGWPSRAGRSAATWRRWRCCAGPTSSMPPSPVRRSRTGRCTTRTTPSATSAARPSIRRRTSAAPCSRTRPSWSGHSC